MSGHLALVAARPAAFDAHALASEIREATNLLATAAARSPWPDPELVAAYHALTVAPLHPTAVALSVLVHPGDLADRSVTVLQTVVDFATERADWDAGELRVADVPVSGWRTAVFSW